MREAERKEGSSPWRLALLGPALGLALVILTGCGDGAGLGRSADIRGLVVGAAGDESATGAFRSRLGVYPLNVNVAETLVRLTPDYRVKPLLATRWEYVGQNTWRFFLRRGLRFHDGQAFTARALYPPVARRLGMEGAVKVAFVLGCDGQLISIGLIRSSRFSVLNMAAFQTVNKDTPLPPPPVGTCQERMRVLVPFT